MPHRELITAATLLLALGASSAVATDPHLDLQVVPRGCAACHRGHGAPGSPMLAKPQKEVCLACHDSRTKADDEVRRGNLAPGTNPPLIGKVLGKASSHPISERAFSRFETAEVVCASCHSPHRRSVELGRDGADGSRRRSTRNPRKFEHELCAECHGNQGPRPQSPREVARLFDPTCRSFHPVLEPSGERALSVVPRLAGKVVNCTDCHGNSDPSGPRGLHASDFRGLLVADYTVADGGQESKGLYRLCYTCHDREKVLDSAAFPLHRLHVVDEKASCATCHNSHGAVKNRALIRFGEETSIVGVAASPTTARVAFTSDSAGSGSCELSCHGVDHGPKVYGVAAFVPSARSQLSPTTQIPAAGTATRAPRSERAAERERRDPPPPR